MREEKNNFEDDIAMLQDDLNSVIGEKEQQQNMADRDLTLQK